MTCNAYLDNVTFEIRYEKDGRKYKCTGRSTADIKHDVFYPTHHETTVTLKNVQEFKGSFVEPKEEHKFYIDNLPSAPFDYFWELKVHEEKMRTIHYDPTQFNN